MQAAVGDVFALVSDGLMEVFDRRDQEFGLERLEQAFAANSELALSELFTVLIARVRRHGPQVDDQSLLLIRQLS